jgi:CBS domain containing-hemolysin-like protein
MLALAFPNRLYIAVAGPAVRVLNAIANAGSRLLGVEPRDELATSASAEELAVMLSDSREEGLIEEVAHQLLSGALDLGDRRITTVMVPRDDVVWLSRSATPADAERLVVRSGHSRLVVAGRDLDDVLGFVHAKDLLTVPDVARDRPMPLGRVRRMLLLGERTSLDDALLAMQRARLHMAVVSDRVGRTLGVATLEDVIEELVGDIRDESDR